MIANNGHAFHGGFGSVLSFQKDKKKKIPPPPQSLHNNIKVLINQLHIK